LSISALQTQASNISLEGKGFCLLFDVPKNANDSKPALSIYIPFIFLIKKRNEIDMRRLGSGTKKNLYEEDIPQIKSC
jgi:hypothetical protein